MREPLSMPVQIVLCLALLVGLGAVWTHRDAGLRMLGVSVAAPSPPSDATAGPPAVPVIVAEVGAARDRVSFEAVGTGRANRSVMLRAESEGKVAEMAIAPGRRFEAGETLIRLDDRVERIALSLAETRLAEAERVLDRYSRLENSGATAFARFDEVRTAAEIARLEVERAEEALDQRTVVAPFDGISGLPSVEPGAWIDSDTDIASFDDRSVLLVEFDLPEALVGRITEGMAATALTSSRPGEAFDATVSAIDSRIDPASRTARVRVSIPNGRDRLRPGASFVITLRIEGERYPLVPELALQFSRGTLSVWRVAGEDVERVDVRLVRREDGLVLVEGDLAPGDRVVVEGTQRLSPGRRVRVTGRDDAAPGGAS